MTLRTLFCMLVVTPVLLTGCGGSNGADAVAWTDNVCGALSGFATTVSSPPAVDRSNPDAAKSSLGTYFTTTVAALQETIRGLKAAGPAPVKGGDEYLSRLTDTLTRVEASFTDAAGRLEQLDTSGPDWMTVALPAVLAPLQELGNLADPTSGLEAVDELRVAAEKAPRCQQLRTG